MLSYCLEWRKKQIVKTQVAKRNKGKLMILSKCAVNDTKKSNFFRKQEASWLLSSLKTTISKIPVLGNSLF